jgi:hypothetical protein
MGLSFLPHAARAGGSRILSGMDEVTLELLDRLLAGRRPKIGPRVLEAEFLAAVERFQHSKRNFERADKSWVWRCEEANRLHFRSVQPLSRSST